MTSKSSQAFPLGAPRLPPGFISRYVNVGGIRTHYLDGGEGDEVVVLLHAGAWGQSAELTWEPNLSALARSFRVVAPDWLGFGRTDKLRDFASRSDRMIQHLADLLAVLDIESAHFVGVSMGATHLVREAARSRPRFPIRRMVICSGGGFVPANSARAEMLAYDGTVPAMRTALRAEFAMPIWEDEDYVRRRVEMSLVPGAWEVAASARLARPGAEATGQFGPPDTTPYECIEVPTLIVAGALDRLREPGYHQVLNERIAGSSAVLLPDGGHMVNFDCADWFNRAVPEFLMGRAPG